MSPKASCKVADTLTADGVTRTKAEREAAFYVASGMRIAAGQDVIGVLDLLPPTIADAIREARAAKRKAAAK